MSSSGTDICRVDKKITKLKSSMDSDKKLRILMFPWLAHGHIFPFLELAKRLILTKNKKFHIYLCSTAINFPSINAFIHSNSLQNSIELIHLHLLPNPLLPPHYHTTKNIPSHLIRDLIKAFQTAKPSFSLILTSLRPDILIYDNFQPWAPQLAHSLAIPAVHFLILGAATSCFAHHNYVCWNDDFPFPELHLEENEKKSLDNLMEFSYANVFDLDKEIGFVNFRFSTEVVLLKTCRGLEGKYIDYVSSLTQKRILPVGPLVTEAAADRDSDSDIMRWLGKKKQHSAVYISFGSEYFLSEEEIVEIAKGLELCEANFVWVIRSPTTEAGGERSSAEEAVLPEGFVERMRERGRVVTGWAPQAAVLGHPSTGAFVSHCGWSSLNESIYHGVPVVGMPMKLNMFVDARMLVDAGACVEVEREGDGVYRGEEIAKAIEVVISSGEERGEGMRRRARELSEKMRAEEEGAIDEVAHHLYRLCCTNSNS